MREGVPSGNLQHFRWHLIWLQPVRRTEGSEWCELGENQSSGIEKQAEHTRGILTEGISVTRSDRRKGSFLERSSSGENGIIQRRANHIIERKERRRLEHQ